MGRSDPKLKHFTYIQLIAPINPSGISIAFDSCGMHARYLAGHITVVQEERFRLTTEDGRSFLFVLDRKSPVHIPAVRRLQKSRTPVRVEYSGEPNTGSGIAHLVQPVNEIFPEDRR